MWKIFEQINSSYYEFENSRVISIGIHNDCEIKTQRLKNKSVHSQMIFDDGFMFHICNEHVEPYFLTANIKIEECIFLIEYLNFYDFKSKYQNIKNFSSIFSSDLFLNLLKNVQRSFFEFHKFNFEMTKVHIPEIIQFASKILAKQMFDPYTIFEMPLRDKFKEILWCLWAQIFEYGIITPAILNPNVSEIMVNGFKKIYFEEYGQIIPANIQFSQESELLSLIERICASMGRRIDESLPYCDARLKEGHRVHAIIPPLSLVGPCLTIRKFPNFSYNIEKLIEQGSLSFECAELLETSIRNKNNIIISGGTGSGKTTLLNCLSAFISESERIVTIEDSAELQLQQPHVIRLECRNENIENQGKITMRDLVRNALRMRPDRIIVGECRGAEALDMLQAMNTGHDGSMTTVHANSPQDALRRIETLVLFAEIDLPSRAIREQLGSAIHLIVQQTRLPSGKRCVTAIEKIIGFDEKKSNIITETIYKAS